jgi:hypothetical protein
VFSLVELYGFFIWNQRKWMNFSRLPHRILLSTPQKNLPDWRFELENALIIQLLILTYSKESNGRNDSKLLLDHFKHWNRSRREMNYGSINCYVVLECAPWLEIAKKALTCPVICSCSLMKIFSWLIPLWHLIFTWRIVWKTRSTLYQILQRSSYILARFGILLLF